MRVILVVLVLLISKSTLAMESYDHTYLESGAVNKKFEIIDYDQYLNVTRTINNEFAKRLPAQVDFQTTYTMVRLSSEGLRLSLYLKGISTKEELESFLDSELYLQALKNRLCGSLPILKTQFFKKTTNGNIIYEINNENLKNLKNYSINYKDCF